jgi:hypothetical protein
MAAPGFEVNSEVRSTDGRRSALIQILRHGEGARPRLQPSNKCRALGLVPDIARDEVEWAEQSATHQSLLIQLRSRNQEANSPLSGTCRSVEIGNRRSR